MKKKVESALIFKSERWQIVWPIHLAHKLSDGWVYVFWIKKCIKHKKKISFRIKSYSSIFINAVLVSLELKALE